MAKDKKTPDEPQPGGWRDVALFVCERCGKERRSQPHLDFVCRECAAERDKSAPAQASEPAAQ